jgi:predicted MPP superfamily phosphohydrolase
MKTTIFLIIVLFLSVPAFSQAFKFAFLSDTHIGVKNADEDLRRSVADINTDAGIEFVLISGDITELGTEDEMLLAKSILSKLNKPLYIQTGNHDGNWSPSGGRIFNTTVICSSAPIPVHLCTTNLQGKCRGKIFCGWILF